MCIIHKFSTDFQIQSSTRKISNSIENFFFLESDIFSSIESMFFIINDIGRIDCSHTAKYEINWLLNCNRFFVYLQILIVESVYSLAFLWKNGAVSPFFHINKISVYLCMFHDFTIIQSNDIISKFQDVFIMLNHQDSVALIQKFFDYLQKFYNIFRM